MSEINDAKFKKILIFYSQMEIIKMFQTGGI